MPPQHPNRVLASITIPDTPTITAAISYAHTNLSPQTFNHIMRSWLIGAASLSHLPSSLTQHIDAEIFAVSAILHDLGWSHNPDLISTDKRFEVDGANAARDFLRTQGWSADRCQGVWDAIALHTIPSIACHSTPTTALVSASVMTELISPDVSSNILGETFVGATQDQWDEINAAFPREGWKEHLHETLVGLCRDKPEGCWGTWVAGFGERHLEGWEDKAKGVDLISGLTRE
ncbi:hypothetical protein EK21DRAFT_72196 [Setomelanomma holmii]|uniref:HD domain-containing protein n=1 Tax=Setomelanomma holmii TaxID=210430 RepID=A0A9P4LJK4_9PLEO|nr:hypothetical protein EK21DRAFT_72196 [Setomelanomma holmii]